MPLTLVQVVKPPFLLPLFGFPDLSSFYNGRYELRSVVYRLHALLRGSSKDPIPGDLRVHFSMHETEGVRAPAEAQQFRLVDLPPDVVEVVLSLSRPLDVLAMREVRPAVRALDMSLKSFADMHCAARGVA